MKTLIFLWSLCQMSCCYETGSHSLWMKATYINGSTPFPKFSGYVMLDDIVFAYYDSDACKFTHKDIHKASNYNFEKDDIGSEYFIKYLHECLEVRASNLNNYFNHTHDIYTYQRAAGCELLDNDKPGMMTCADAYNGEAVEQAYYDVDHEALHFTQKLTDSKSVSWTQQYGTVFMYKNTFQPNCIKFLKKHLAKERNRVMKKVRFTGLTYRELNVWRHHPHMNYWELVKPRVRLLQRKKSGSAGVLLTCLATGFYPRHINLTLLRDGQPVSDHLITGGELLPNGDETYQMRKSLEVSREELQHHHYTCTAEHLSLDNKLDIHLERDWDSITTTIKTTTLVLSVCCLVGAIGVFIVYKKMRADLSSQASNTVASGESSLATLARNSTGTTSTDDSEKIELTTPLVKTSQ